MDKKDYFESINFTSHPSPERGLDRLWWMASLRGLKATLPEQAKVLEIGCATGRHLLAMAASLPKASFTGIDLSAAQIDKANKLQQVTGLRNVQFITADFTTFSIEQGQYDYIIANGIYSWIPDDTAQKLLEVIANALSANGVAYVSHNCNPGYYSRQSVGSIVNLFDNKNLSEIERIAIARKSLAYAEDRLVDAFRHYGLQLKEEISRNQRRSDSFILHELLNENSFALTLNEMISRARQANLKYLSDAHPSRVDLSGVLLEGIPADNILSFEQQAELFDLLYPASFRGTLLVHADRNLTDSLNILQIKNTHLSCPLVYDDDIFSQEDLLNFKMVPFYGPSEETFEAKAPALKLILKHLGCEWPAAVSYHELLTAAKTKVAIAEDEKIKIVESLFSLYARNLLDIYAAEPSISKSIEEMPLVAPLTRFSLEEDWVSTLRSEIFLLDPLDRILLPLLDGTNSNEQLVLNVMQAVQEGQLILRSEGHAIATSDVRIKEYVSEAVNEKLTSYKEQALLLRLS